MILTLSNATEEQSIAVTQQDNVQGLSVEQADGTQEIPVSPDVKFLRGFSPTIEVEEAMGGFNVTITDADHSETIFIASAGEVSEEQIVEAVNAYLAENPVQSGATAEQVEQIERNATDIAELAEKVEGIEVLEVPSKISELENDAGYLTDFTEADPTVPSWAKQANPPSYTAADVGAEHIGAVSEHNVSTEAHNDIRLFLQELTERVNALADSDDETLDQMSEVVAYIKANRELIESVTTAKVNVSDIIDNLTTNVSDRPLSAAQGVALKALIDAIEIPTVPTKVSAFENDKGYLTELPEHEHPQYLTEHQPLDAYALKTDIPTVPTTEETVAAVNAARTTETWTFTLEDGTEVTKTVVLA